jgi:hypothetical protein
VVDMHLLLIFLISSTYLNSSDLTLQESKNKSQPFYKYLLLPGWAQISSGDYKTGYMLLGIEATLLAGCVISEIQYRHWENEYNSIDNPYTPNFVFESYFSNMHSAAQLRNYFAVLIVTNHLLNGILFREKPESEKDVNLFIKPDGITIVKKF